MLNVHLTFSFNEYFITYLLVQYMYFYAQSCDILFEFVCLLLQLQRAPSSISEPCSKEQSPRLFDIFLIECAVAKVQVALDEYFSRPLVNFFILFFVFYFLLLVIAQLNPDQSAQKN